MNVKQGDLAIQIKSIAGNEGAIVKVIEPYNDETFDGLRWCVGAGFKWLCEFTRPVKSDMGITYKIAPVPDAWLRPISGLPMEEETEQKLKEPA